MTRDGSTNPKKAYGDLKPPVGLCPYAGLKEQARALAQGADKYGPFNWRVQEIDAMTYAHAMIRHIEEWIDGCDADADSEAHPLGHVMAGASIALDAIQCGTLVDNRPGVVTKAAVKLDKSFDVV